MRHLSLVAAIQRSLPWAITSIDPPLLSTGSTFVDVLIEGRSYVIEVPGEGKEVSFGVSFTGEPFSGPDVVFDLEEDVVRFLIDHSGTLQL